MTITKKKPDPQVEPDIHARLAAVEEQVSFLLKGRPGRKYLPITTSEDHVCGVDPERDPTTCEDASLWRRNKGCKGDACVAKSTLYYQNYRANRSKKDSDSPVAE